MEIRRFFTFVGPSLLSHEAVIRLTLDPQEHDLLSAGWEAGRTAGWLQRLLPEDNPLWSGSEGPPRGLCLADCIVLMALALQREFGFAPQACGRIGKTPAGEVEVFFAYADGLLGLNAGRLAVALVGEAAGLAEGEETLPAVLSGSFDHALAQMKQAALLPTTRRSVWAAERRGIPWRRLGETDGIVQLGQGHKLRRLRGSYWRDTSYLAVRIAGSKASAAELLRNHGIPVPNHRLVINPDAAVAAAETVGYPVVVKPNNRDQGTAVTINVVDAAGVQKAFAVASAHGPVLVEATIPGDDHRVTMLNGRMIAAGSDKATEVIGDGQSSIGELIDAANADPRRGHRDFSDLREIRLEPRVLQLLDRQGYDLDSVPPAGRRVALRPWWRQGKDHSAVDLTADVHPDNRAMFERAARLIGIDLAGIDYISPDIARPWYEVGGAINEINPTPGLMTHVRAGGPDVHRIIVDSFYPADDDGRVPLVATLLWEGSDRTLGLLTDFLASQGHRVGFAGSKGLSIAGALVLRRDASGPSGARLILDDPITTACLLELSEKNTADLGLGFDRADVAAILSPPANLEAAKLLLEVCTGVLILNADEPEVAGLMQHGAARRVCLVSSGKGADVARSHVAAGGWAVLIEEEAGRPGICLLQGADRHVICRLDEIPALRAKATEGAAEAYLCTAAMAVGLGLPPESLRQFLEGAGTRPPGR